MEKQLLKKAVYDACLKSASVMGARVKEMSWFGKSHSKATMARRSRLPTADEQA